MNSLPIPIANSAAVAADLATRGTLIRVGWLRGEWYDEVDNPATVLASIRQTQARLDIFSFLQRPPDTSKKFPYYSELDHVAAIPIRSYEHWWENQVAKKVRKNVRRCEKSGVIISQVPFDDTLIRGIQRIYDESPLRGGRPFKHYKDDLETCRRKHETYRERSAFIAAHYEGELIGFIKLVFAGGTARTMQNISMIKHRDLSCANAMLAKAVNLCVQKEIQFLVYGRLAYGKKGNDGLEEFKISNGFVRVDYRRYYVPLTPLGNLAIRWGLHREMSELFPKRLVRMARRLRGKWYDWRFGSSLGCTSNIQPQH
jgi:hypothetical protein